MGQMEPRSPDPSQMRISDADRQKVAEVLRDAAGEGRIDFEELDERLEQTWAARTYADLVPITIDLQAHPQAASPPPTHFGTLPSHPSSVAIMGECKRQGNWSVPARHSTMALMGTVTIDLRQAAMTSHDTTINANAIMGEVQVVVPAHFHVIVDGTPIMGEFHQTKDKIEPDVRHDSPVVRVRGVALMGSVTVRRLPPPGTKKKFLGTY